MNKLSLLKQNRIRRRLNLFLLLLAYVPAIALFKYAESLATNPPPSFPLKEEARSFGLPDDYYQTQHSERSSLWVPGKP